MGKVLQSFSRSPGDADEGRNWSAEAGYGCGAVVVVVIGIVRCRWQLDPLEDSHLYNVVLLTLCLLATA